MNFDIFASLLFNDILLFALISLIAGACSGLFGIGGGTILVPIFLYTLPHYLPAPFLAKYLHHTAVATSIACIFLMACVSGISHFIKKFTPEKSLYFLALGSLLGAYINTRYFFMHLSGRWIHILFIIFMWINIYFLFQSTKKNNNIDLNIKKEGFAKYNSKYSLALCFIAGAIISIIASTIGLGGGFIVVPLLLHLGFTMHLAIASSIMNGIALAVGSLFAYYQLRHLNQVGFLLDFNAHQNNTLNMVNIVNMANMKYMLGFVYLPAVLIIAPIACLTAFFSTRLAYRLPQLLLKRLFAAFLGLVSVFLMLK